jgi:hypothetical protein
MSALRQRNAPLLKLKTRPLAPGGVDVASIAHLFRRKNMSLEYKKRLDYFDRAFKWNGLSLGRPEADEIPRLEGQLGVNETVADPIAGLHRRPLSGLDVNMLLAIAEMASAKVIGVWPPIDSDRFLNVPGLGTTAVRIVLPNPTLGDVLRLEGSDLNEAEAYLLCEVNPDQAETVRLVGWAGREAVRCSPKVRLEPDQPEVYVVGVESRLPAKKGG